MIFTASGIAVVPPSPERDPDYQSYGDHEGFSQFHGRVPLLWHPQSRRVYLGAPNWYHQDVVKHHGLDDYKSAMEMTHGMVKGGPEWGNGHLTWFRESPEEHPEIAQALEDAGIEVPNHDQPTVPDLNPFKDLQPQEDVDLNDPDLWKESGVKGFKKWWKQKGPARPSNAASLAEYACLEHMSREECKTFIDDHEDEIQGDPDEFRRKFFRKFDLFC